MIVNLQEKKITGELSKYTNMIYDERERESLNTKKRTFSQYTAYIK